jgi:predicted NodU family carbamoyl transferase
MRELLVTTGHNSSAILIEDGQLMWGYETERVTGVKSDSRFPLPHIEEWGQQIGKIDLAHVSHWAPTGALSSMSTKHWDPSRYFDGVPIHAVAAEPERSHHDTHMHAALRYADGSTHGFPRHGTYGLVIDGFGTLGEHLSVYDLSKGVKLVKRIHGYGTSLGLWYQYATAFMGMKMHEDEYKLLGYEAHVTEQQWFNATSLASIESSDWLEDMDKSVYGSKYDPLYDLTALANVKAKIFEKLTRACEILHITDVHSVEGRAVLACYVQSVLERVVSGVVGRYAPHNLILSGGVCYNVKLNKLLMESVAGLTCVYPLAGDQGNALGLYAMAHPEWQFPDTLCWGRRILRDVGHVEGLYVGTMDQVHDFALRQLKTVGYVNLVRGNMEFGPRALCNTSTLALPTMANVSRINAMNERNTVMPMAPVISRKLYRGMFERTDHVWKSHRHMVIAMEYQDYPCEEHMGVAHKYRHPGIHHTGRPQVIDGQDILMNSLLDECGGMLINTSFNFHGKPIALGMDSIVSNHSEERRRDDTITTAVIANDYPS